MEPETGPWEPGDHQMTYHQIARVRNSYDVYVNDREAGRKVKVDDVILAYLQSYGSGCDSRFSVSTTLFPVTLVDPDKRESIRATQIKIGHVFEGLTVKQIFHEMTNLPWNGVGVKNVIVVCDGPGGDVSTTLPVTNANGYGYAMYRVERKSLT